MLKIQKPKTLISIEADMPKTHVTTIRVEENLFRLSKSLLALKGISLTDFIQLQLRNLVEDPDGELNITELQNPEKELALK